MKNREVIRDEVINGHRFTKAIVPVGNSCRIECRFNGKRISQYVYSMLESANRDAERGDCSLSDDTDKGNF